MPSKPANIEKLGPGTLTIGTQPFDFSCEVKGVQVTHEYDTEDPETMLCGDVVTGKASRSDGLDVQLYNDLTDTGLYKYLMDHDLEEVDFVFTPNTGTDAVAGGTASTPEKWEGKIQLTLPESIGAEEYGANIESEVSWAGTTLFTFTPRTDSST